MGKQDATVDPGILAAVAAMPGLCGQPLSRGDIDVLEAVSFGEGHSGAGCVAVISHGGHEHYLAALLRSGKHGWVIEQAAQTDGDRGVPRVAPAIFIGPGSWFSVVGWAPTARANRMVLEIGPFRSSPTPMYRGIVIAQFNLPLEASKFGSRIRYLDDADELQAQSFGLTGGFVSTEFAVQR
jgi:hypothetical protein